VLHTRGGGGWGNSKKGGGERIKTDWEGSDRAEEEEEEEEEEGDEGWSVCVCVFFFFMCVGVWCMCVRACVRGRAAVCTSRGIASHGNSTRARPAVCVSASKQSINQYVHT
jgi:hypothetical protein